METIMYLCSERDKNLEIGKELNLSEKALKKFKYALFQVKFKVHVDETTGKTKILEVDDMPLIRENYLSEDEHKESLEYDYELCKDGTD